MRALFWPRSGSDPGQARQLDGLLKRGVSLQRHGEKEERRHTLTLMTQPSTRRANRNIPKAALPRR